MCGLQFITNSNKQRKNVTMENLNTDWIFVGSKESLLSFHVIMAL